jgi:hypothetical protein
MAPKGTPAERRQTKADRRRKNQVEHVRTRAQQVVGGHQKVVVACNAALAASKRISDDARRLLAKAIADVVVVFDTAENRKEQP